MKIQLRKLGIQSCGKNGYQNLLAIVTETKLNFEKYVTSLCNKVRKKHCF